MSLQVWLPLTKDLRQQGLSNVTVTNNGATFNSAGKLGGCYEFASGKRIQTTLPASTSLNTKAISFACWMYITSWNSSYDCFMSIADGTGWVQSRATLCRNNTASTLTWNIADGTNRAYVTTTTALSLNTWTHVAGTYDGTNLKIYINGVLNNTTATTLNIGYAGTFNIGGWSGANYPFNGRLNDVRVYNHCLSPMEIKELAKGLVLHYPLNRQGWGQENILKNTGNNIFSTSTIGSWTNGDIYAGSGGNGTFSITLDNTVPVGKYSWNILNNTTGNRDFQQHNIPYVEGKKYTMSWYAKGSGTCLARSWNDNAGTEAVRSTYTLTDNWKYYTWTFTATAAMGTGVCTWHLGCTGTSSINMCGMKLEEGEKATSWCPNISDTLATTINLNGITEYDCSGFCNNGIRTGTFTWTSDTPKYSVSQYFTDYTRYITTPLNGWTPITLTVSCWIKSSNKSPRGNWHIPLSLDGQKAEISIGTSGKARIGFTIGGTRYVYDWGNDILNGTWHLITNVFDGSSMKMYIDGILVNSSSVSGTLQSMNNLYVGRFNGVDTYGNTQLYESDVRVYATALSASDILSLYQNSAYIDSSDNVYGAVHTEV